MWDERYADKDYAYGKEPNTFLAENYQAIPQGRVLSLAEGEGRNAVFLAQKGYSVTAVDGSEVGLKKAEMLAKEKGVEIELIHADLAEFDIGEDIWDGIISIFCPLPTELRSQVYKSAVNGLKAGGVFLLEAYTPEQLKHATGGGHSIDSMTTKESLLSDLGRLNFSQLQEIERDVIEGIYHTGKGAVIQAVATK
ncbi:class I SAM-dependent methyltransferase [Aliiglaciecola sp. 2_MG-2023]|uniref:SAM-dependent methyltransferase n=1 Tax=unclassified Aliiglaciecola TaxID=2593648 RepID=UPI0026E2E5C6|nr:MULTISPECIES: class I SAM-dependent methyltransferase [unclassified Aliiglaciecola]MDO6713106.1 class I SAM-dependent methyltransferase [Aliiglaciecola sp. 2_MG-2023]MDO6754128.1 class I SAM-dependent methyltransferase [Aliiglaciecola sp. 1_MG-2023]